MEADSAKECWVGSSMHAGPITVLLSLYEKVRKTNEEERNFAAELN